MPEYFLSAARRDVARFSIIAAGIVALMLVLEFQLSDARMASRVEQSVQDSLKLWANQLSRLGRALAVAPRDGSLAADVSSSLRSLMVSTQVESIDIRDPKGQKVWSIATDPAQFEAVTVVRQNPVPSAPATSNPSLSVQLPLPYPDSPHYKATLHFAPAVLAGMLQAVTSTLALTFFGFTLLVLMATLSYRNWHARRTEARMRKLSRLDSLTGIPHRTTFIHRLDELMQQRALPASGFAVIFIDIHRFSDINQNRGSEAADQVLRVTAYRLRTAGKVVSLLARLGGDQFAIIMEGIEAEDAATFHAEQILNLVRQPVEWHDGDMRVAVCIGLVLSPHHGSDRSTLMKHADLALQHAKALGANQIAMYSAVSAEHHEARRGLERLVLEATEDHSFELHFQPIIDMRSSRIAGFEALLRLRGKDGRPVSPGEFVPVLEHLGKIDEVGCWAITRACELARLWPEASKVAVNLSPLQFRSGRLPGAVDSILAATGCPPERLELEVTENLVLDRSKHVHQQLEVLQEMGIDIVLDDFGTGYSSLSYLCQFAFDKIKIDQEFIRGAGTSPRARGILRTIVTLARRFDLPVTAEGVETSEQLDLVKALKCQFAQGFLFSRPVPETEVAGLIMRNFVQTPREVAEPKLEQRPRLIAVNN